MDMEKVIKGVHDARRYLEDREWVDKSVGVHIDALNDALELLKEQEPKTGRWIDSAGDDKCSVCGATYGDLYPDYQYTHYCPNCGAKMIIQEVKLE